VIVHDYGFNPKRNELCQIYQVHINAAMDTETKHLERYKK
jgi:hypothetical protein